MRAKYCRICRTKLDDHILVTYCSDRCLQKITWAKKKKAYQIRLKVALQQKKLCRTCGKPVLGNRKIYCTNNCVPWTGTEKFRSMTYKTQIAERLFGDEFNQSLQAIKAAWMAQKGLQKHSVGPQKPRQQQDDGN